MFCKQLIPYLRCFILLKKKSPRDKPEEMLYDVVKDLLKFGLICPDCGNTPKVWIGFGTVQIKLRLPRFRRA